MMKRTRKRQGKRVATLSPEVIAAAKRVVEIAKRLVAGRGLRSISH